MAVGALGLVLAGALPVLAAAEDTVAFRIRDSRITESSGLTRDTAAQLYWTVNDSGSAGVAYGLAPDGKVRGTLNFRAPVTDVEAVALKNDRLYVADIGDNDTSRDMVTVYFFPSPRANGLTVTYRAYDFRYPDGPHDAETLLVDDDGRLFVVTKGTNGGAVYRAPKDPSRSGVNELRKVGDAPPLVTDGVYLPGGTQIALLTYTSVVVVDADSYEQVATAPVKPLRQAESMALSLDGKRLMVGSEGRNSRVYSVSLPTAAASPSPSASPGGDSGGQSDEDPVDEPAVARNRGTYLALGLAAVVALVAGMVVALVRKP